MASSDAQTTAVHILDVARGCFAGHGFLGTSLNEIADEVGIRRPSLFHHFPSKEALYRAVLARDMADWFDLVDDAVGEVEPGWPQVEKVLTAAFDFFETHPDFVRMVRREAIDGGPILQEVLAVSLRPLFHRAVSWLEAEMDAGRLVRYDPAHLLLTGYGAILSWFSDAPLAAALVRGDPLGRRALARQRALVLDLFQSALAS